MEINRRALWLAINSEYGKRLVHIAQEHSHLSSIVSEVNRTDAEEIVARINQLRSERESILLKFERKVPDEQVLERTPASNP